MGTNIQNEVKYSNLYLSKNNLCEKYLTKYISIDYITSIIFFVVCRFIFCSSKVHGFNLKFLHNSKIEIHLIFLI